MAGKAVGPKAWVLLAGMYKGLLFHRTDSSFEEKRTHRNLIAHSPPSNALH